MVNSDSEDPSKIQSKDNVCFHEVQAVKLPPFWAHSPATWFIQAEAQFALSRITSDATKYNYVVANLSQDIAESIADQLESPPTTEMYENIKKILIARHSLSIEKRISQLISGEQMGDKSPSEFYRALKKLAGPSSPVGDDLILKLWLNRLPNLINIALIPLKKTDMDSILTTADQIWEALSTASGSTSSVNAVASSSEDARFRKLESEMKELKSMIANISCRPSFRSRSRGRSFNRSKSKDSRSKSSHSLCWYHFKFGEKAHKCIEPCEGKTKFPGSASGSKN